MTPRPAGDAFPALVQRLRAGLAGALPGHAAQWEMAPGHRPPPAEVAARVAGGRPSAALVLVYPLDGAPAVVLTVRSAGLRDHAGQVSLPGGRLEPGETAEAAAVREAAEELAVTAGALELLGRLSPLWIPPSNFTVQPVVAAARARPRLVGAPGEVAAVLEVPLAALAAPDARREEEWSIRGTPSRVPHFRIEGQAVWGATAMILAELLAVWRASVGPLDGPR